MVDAWWYAGRQTSENNTTVHVGNLIGTETEENMRNAFKEFGQIDNVRVPGKNFGFVAFTTHLAVSTLAAAVRIEDWDGYVDEGYDQQALSRKGRQRESLPQALPRSASRWPRPEDSQSRQRLLVVGQARWGRIPAARFGDTCRRWRDRGHLFRVQC